VIKGMRAAGHMGDERVTTLNLRVERVDGDDHLLMLRGAVPGARGSYVLVRKAVARKPDPKPQPEKARKGKK
jgi:large subunit ribosomal protein L3